MVLQSLPWIMQSFELLKVSYGGDMGAKMVGEVHCRDFDIFKVYILKF